MRFSHLALSLLPVLIGSIGCPESSDPLAITTTALPGATVGQDYSFQLAAAGGDGAYTFSAADALPAGIQLASDGLLSGRPTMDGSFTFTAEVMDGAGESARRALTMTIEAAPPAELTIATSSLLEARVDVAYERGVTAQGGTGAYAWSVSAGELPPGLELDASGTPSTTLSGTPTMDGSYTFTITVTDEASKTANKEFTLVVEARQQQPFGIRTFMLADGTVFQPYAADIQVQNVDPEDRPVTWAVESGALPPGLVLDENGDPHTTVTGTPTVEGEYEFVVRATEEDGDTATAELTLIVLPTFIPIAIQTSSVATATAGVPYNEMIIARYGTGMGFSWEITGGELPPGLMIGRTGTPAVLVNGTPLMSGTWTATVTVRDGNGDTASRELDFTVVDPPLTIVTAQLAPGDLGAPYNATIIAAGGSGTGYAWRVSAGDLPPGLALQASASDNVGLEGIPAAVGVYDFTIEVSESGGQVATQPYSLEIFAPVEVVTSTLPDGEIGTGYAATLAAQGGSGGYTYQVTSGTLPPGLMLEPSGVFSGTPTDPGSYGFTVTALDSRSRSGSRALTIDVFAPQLFIPAVTLPGAGAGVAYTATISAVGGSGAGYLWTIDSGALPPGLSITAAATPTTDISGTTAALGSHTFTVRVTDSLGATATQDFTIEVLPPLQIVTTAIPDRSECASQRDVITASGGSGTGYVWTAVSGLPPGLAVGADGTPSTTLFGRATAPATYSLVLRVRDSAGLTAERTFSVAVNADPAAQRYAIMVGDLVTGNDTEVFLTDVCGEAASGLTALNIAAPGTGDASTDPDDALFSPDLQRIAFIGDFMNDTTNELFLTTAANPAMTQRISGPIVANGDVRDLFWSPDSALVVYLADQNTDGIDEIFVVDVSNPALPSFPVQVNAPLAGTGSNVSHVFWAPDSGGLIYRADATDEVFELFYVDLSIPTVPGTPVRLHGALTAPQTCDPNVQWSPAGNAVLFRCDSATAGVAELWYVRFTAGVPGAAQRVNNTLVAGGNVQLDSFSFSPDSTGIAYLADQTTDEIVELYLAVAIGGSIFPGMRAMNALGAGEDVTAFEFGPTGVRGLLRGDLDADEVFELYLVDSSGGFPVTPVRLNGPMVAGGDVDTFDFGFSPDGDRVAYIADQELDEHPELYVLDVSGAAPGNPVRVSPVLAAGADTSVDTFAFSPDSARIAMRGDFFVASQAELAAADLGDNSVQVLNLPLPTGGDVSYFVWRADSAGLLFESDMVANNDTEGWSVDVSGPTASPPLRLHPPVPANGDLEFLWLEP